MGVNVPSVDGGAEAGVISYALSMVEIARACASTAVTMAVTNMVGEVLSAFGTEEQRSLIRRLTEGETLGAFALSEPDAGSDPGAIRTTATRSGGDWVLNGSKQWISHADASEVMVVWARTGQSGTSGLTCFLLNGTPKGLSIARSEDKLGLRGSHTCALSLDDVRLPRSSMLGDEGEGFRIAMMALDGGRIGIGAQALGIAEGALSDAVEYAKTRHTFGEAIASRQAIQWMIADSRTELDAGHLLVRRAAWLKEAGQPHSREAAMAKLTASEAAWQVCDRALQIHGGVGYTRDTSIERRLRDVRVTRIYEGTSEIQRMVIARSVLA